jgi:poly(glycerol-phosphate) alpha-glucosyltransferase
VRELIDAWGMLERTGRRGDWRLEIAGWGPDEYVAAVKARTAELGLGASVSFVGPRFGEDKAESYRSADAFILPSYSEGMPMTVLEAWSYGLPVLMTRECRLDIGFERGAAVEIPLDPAGLADALGAFLLRPAAERVAMGQAGRSLVEAEFTWAKAAAQMTGAYRWAIGAAGAPAWVEMGAGASNKDLRS